MLLTEEKVIRKGICHTIHQFVKTNNQYMRDYDKIKESLYLRYLDVNNLYGWGMSQKMSVSGFQWVKGTSEFNEGFIES